jgi:hypothetical protein
MTEPDDDLPALRDPTGPRRTDQAFARAVAADVAQRRRFAALGPLLAPVGVGIAILAVVVARAPTPPSPSLGPGSRSGEVVAAVSVTDPRVAARDDAEDGIADEAGEPDDMVVAADLDIVVEDLDDAALLAWVAPVADPGSFAFEGLDGSTDRELDEVERAFDAALAKKL